MRISRLQAGLLALAAAFTMGATSNAEEVPSYTPPSVTKPEIDHSAVADESFSQAWTPYAVQLVRTDPAQFEAFLVSAKSAVPEAAARIEAAVRAAVPEAFVAPSS